MRIFHGPPLLYGKDRGARHRFGLSLHVGDVGHTLVVGPTGAGKSVLLALMALQFRRYPGAQVFAFDFGGSIRAATLAMGGDWHRSGRRIDRRRGSVGSSSSRSPGSTIPPSAAGAAGWISAILAREGTAITPEVKEHLWSPADLAGLRPDRRTHDHRSRGPAAILRPETSPASLLPSAVPMGDSSMPRPKSSVRPLSRPSRSRGWSGPRRRPRCYSYLFPPDRPTVSTAGRRLPDHPTRAGSRLTTRGFAGQLREWLKTLRKKNASVIFATQSLLGHRRLGHRARDHRKLPDPGCSCPKNGPIEPQIRPRSNRRFGPSRPGRSNDLNRCPRHAQAGLLMPVAARANLALRIGPLLRRGASALCGASFQV